MGRVRGQFLLGFCLPLVGVLFSFGGQLLYLGGLEGGVLALLGSDLLMCENRSLLTIIHCHFFSSIASSIHYSSDPLLSLKI